MKIIEELKNTIERPDTRVGRAFDITIQGLILLSLLSFSVETLPGLSNTTQRVLSIIELVTVIIFTLEYSLRVLVADKKLRFVFSFFGIIDLVAVLPFYFSTGVDLRSVRAIRLIRVFRAFKFFRYSAAIARFSKAFVLAREELVSSTSTTFSPSLYFFSSFQG